MGTEKSFELAVHRHDECIAELGLDIWVGSEPTFTDRESQAPFWLHAALGGDKEQRAQALLRNLSGLMEGGLLLRSIGRMYPGEKLPRWNLGLLRYRDGRPVWGGPPDPLMMTVTNSGDLPDIGSLAGALSDTFKHQDWSAQCTQAMESECESAWQVTVQIGDTEDDSLTFLFHVVEVGGVTAADRSRCVALELPAIGHVALFMSILACIEQVALSIGLPALVFTGAAPPVDETLELTTITPDPAVIEINTAPSKNCTEFLGRSRQVYAAAAALKLSPYRLYFNGQVADSGGAGQITFGGVTPADSPFVKYPQLLPRLVRFLNRHPALSYLFAHDYVGASGQSVRPDERGTDAVDDLLLALVLLERQQEVSPELLWKSLASFLCDAVGNSHRSEINIEKLWNPFLPGRGCLGLVEFRSLRMQHTPQRATAIACLFRALIAMLVSRPYTLPLIDWGRELHDRFALPFYLSMDLDAVLAQLEGAGLGLEKEICRVLRQNEYRFFGKVDLPFGTLELWRGLEFWPLVGDAASPAQTGTSRMVDASTARIEVRWRQPSTEPGDTATLGHWLDWGFYVGETRLPMRLESDAGGGLKVFGVRYSSFVPMAGLHPILGVQAPLTLTLRHGQFETQYVIKLHEWQPDGLAYPCLPKDLEDARERRSNRITVIQENRSHALHPPESGAEKAQSSLGLTDYCLDMRYHP